MAKHAKVPRHRCASWRGRQVFAEAIPNKGAGVIACQTANPLTIGAAHVWVDSLRQKRWDLLSGLRALFLVTTHG